MCQDIDECEENSPCKVYFLKLFAILFVFRLTILSNHIDMSELLMTAYSQASEHCHNTRGGHKCADVSCPQVIIVKTKKKLA